MLINKIIVKLKGSALRRIKFLMVLWNFSYYLYDDIRRGRFLGVILIGLGNLLPDFLCFSFIRPIFWKMSGVRMVDATSSVIRKNVFIEYPHNLTIGKNFQVNIDTYLDTNEKITIGDNVTISLSCNILTTSHSGLNHAEISMEPVVIKDHCLIYANCNILPGAILEEGVILAAGSVLKGETKPWSLYAGNPAKFIRKITSFRV